MAISYGNFVASEIPNTTKQEILRDGELYLYQIRPIDGYVTHDKRDDAEFEGVLTRYYASSGFQHIPNYDMTTSQITIEVRDENGNIINEVVTAYGEYEFFALERSKVPNPEIEIYGDTDADHEIM